MPALSTNTAFPTECLPPHATYYNTSQPPLAHCHNTTTNSNVSTRYRDPKTRREAQRSVDAESWAASEAAEIAAWRARDVFERVPITDGMVIVSAKWVYKKKTLGDGSLDKYKGRYCARGFSQHYGVDYDETFAPTLNISSLRVLLQLTATFKLHLRHFDIHTAYLYADLDTNVFLQPAPDFEDPGYVWRLKKAVYGLKNSARCWNQHFHNHLLSIGFTQSQFDPCVYIRGSHSDDTFLALATFVDDIAAAGSNVTLTDTLLAELRTVFSIDDKGDLEWFLSLSVDRTGGGDLLIHQTAYLHDVLERFGITDTDTGTAASPLPTNYAYARYNGTASPGDTTTYRQIVGAIRWLTLTRPDICFSLNNLARNMSNPGPEHLFAAMHLLRHLRKTADDGIHYRHAGGQFLIEAYADSDLGGDNEKYQSTAGYMIRLNHYSAPVSFASRLMHDVATSTCHAEYVALYEATREVVHLRGLLGELLPSHCLPLPASKILGDNAGALALCKNPKHNKRNKHFPIKLHYTRQIRESGAIDVFKTPTAVMWADSLTKQLPGPAHKLHKQVLLGTNGYTPPDLQGMMRLVKAPANSSTCYSCQHA